MKKFISFHYFFCLSSPIIAFILIFIAYGQTTGFGDSTDSSYYNNGKLDVAKRSLDYASANTALDTITAILLVYLAISSVIIFYKYKMINSKLLLSSLFALIVYLLLFKFDIVV